MQLIVARACAAVTGDQGGPLPLPSGAARRRIACNPAAARGAEETHATEVRLRLEPNFQHYSPGALARSLAQHAEIAEAARAREPAWAEAVMRSHLHNARAAMLGDTAEVPS
jgi:DNA-binding FadR family transcriptional regulator